METFHYSIDVDAPVDVVWNTMLDDGTYREWTSGFHEGSCFQGGWAEGDAIRFLGPSENGTEGGMIGCIVASRPHEFLSIEYSGLVENGVDDFDSDFAKQLAGSHENYSLVERDGVTPLSVDLDSIKECTEMFDASWPVALEARKQIAERPAR